MTGNLWETCRVRHAAGVFAACICASTTFAEAKSITVAPTGADFATVQAAIDSVPDKNADPVVITIQPGTYKEHLAIKKGTFITLKGAGDDPSKVVLTYDLFANSVVSPATKPVGTTGSASVTIDADNFTAVNLTFANSSGDKGQAVAVKTNSDKLIFRKCRFIGGQDTLYPNGGRTYFVDCYIEGHVDFIFGRATAVFQNCELHSLPRGGCVTAASTLENTPFGFVFLDCKLTGEGKGKNQLGRPWRPYSAVAYINCDMGDHINPVGWDNWGKTENEKTARYSEFNSKGPGANPSARVSWAKQLSTDEAAKYTVSNILAGTDNWDPTK